MTRLGKRTFNSLLAVGSFAFYFLAVNGLTGSPMALISYHWAELDAVADGEIVRSEVDHGRHGRTTPLIRYVFVAGDRSYRSNIVSYRSVGEEEAYTTVARYPVGEIVTVHYDSNAPYFSVLEPGPLDWSIYFQVFCGLIMATLTALVFRRK